MPSRPDLFVCFTNDKDLMHKDSIMEKAKNFTGIAIRIKTAVTSVMMKKVLGAIENDWKSSFE